MPDKPDVAEPRLVYIIGPEGPVSPETNIFTDPPAGSLWTAATVIGGGSTTSDLVNSETHAQTNLIDLNNDLHDCINITSNNSNEQLSDVVLINNEVLLSRNPSLFMDAGSRADILFGESRNDLLFGHQRVGHWIFDTTSATFLLSKTSSALDFLPPREDFTDDIDDIKHIMMEHGASDSASDFVQHLAASAINNPHLGVAELKQVAQAYSDSMSQSATSSAPSEVPDPGPMPTYDELKTAGKLYSQAYKADRSIDIVQHLRNVWMPWIAAGILTQPELGKKNRDPSAYKALVIWPGRTGKNLKDELGYDIQSKSEIIDSHIAAVADLPAGERPVKLTWVAEKRAKRAKEATER